MSWFDNSPCSPLELYTNILLEEQIRDNLRNEVRLWVEAQAHSGGA